MEGSNSGKESTTSADEYVRASLLLTPSHSYAIERHSPMFSQSEDEQDDYYEEYELPPIANNNNNNTTTQTPATPTIIPPYAPPSTSSSTDDDDDDKPPSQYSCSSFPCSNNFLAPPSQSPMIDFPDDDDFIPSSQNFQRILTDHTPTPTPLPAPPLPQKKKRVYTSPSKPRGIELTSSQKTRLNQTHSIKQRQLQATLPFFIDRNVRDTPLNKRGRPPTLLESRFNKEANNNKRRATEKMPIITIEDDEDDEKEKDKQQEGEKRTTTTMASKSNKAAPKPPPSISSSKKKQKGIRKPRKSRAKSKPVTQADTNEAVEYAVLSSNNTTTTTAPPTTTMQTTPPIPTPHITTTATLTPTPTSTHTPPLDSHFPLSHRLNFLSRPDLDPLSYFNDSPRFLNLHPRHYNPHWIRDEEDEERNDPLFNLDSCRSASSPHYQYYLSVKASHQKLQSRITQMKSGKLGISRTQWPEDERPELGYYEEEKKQEQQEQQQEGETTTKQLPTPLKRKREYMFKKDEIFPIEIFPRDTPVHLIKSNARLLRLLPEDSTGFILSEGFHMLVKGRNASNLYGTHAVFDYLHDKYYANICTLRQMHSDATIASFITSSTSSSTSSSPPPIPFTPDPFLFSQTLHLHVLLDSLRDQLVSSTLSSWRSHGILCACSDNLCLAHNSRRSYFYVYHGTWYIDRGCYSSPQLYPTPCYPEKRNTTYSSSSSCSDEEEEQEEQEQMPIHYGVYRRSTTKSVRGEYEGDEDEWMEKGNPSVKKLGMIFTVSRKNSQETESEREEQIIEMITRKGW